MNELLLRSFVQVPRRGGREDRQVDATYENNRSGGGRWGSHGSGDNSNRDGRTSSYPPERGGGGNKPWRRPEGGKPDIKWEDW